MANFAFRLMSFLRCLNRHEQLVRARRIFAAQRGNAFIAVASGAPTELPERARPVNQLSAPRKWSLKSLTAAAHALAAAIYLSVWGDTPVRLGSLVSFGQIIARWPTTARDPPLRCQSDRAKTRPMR
jgi:hypothetical protein